MPALLELFKGTGSIGRAFEAWTSCPNSHPPSAATFCAGTTAPPSRALTTSPRRLHEGDALVLRAIEIIAYLAPRLWAIENPQTGLLKTRPFMQRLGFVDATYCLYGTPFKKQTRFWTNMRWAPSCGLCGPGNRCEAWENGRHARAAQRGPRKIGQRYENVRRQSRELLYSIPAALCDEIAAAASET